MMLDCRSFTRKDSGPVPRFFKTIAVHTLPFVDSNHLEAVCFLYINIGFDVPFPDNGKDDILTKSSGRPRAAQAGDSEGAKGLSSSRVS
jgi:hypothetical protein